MALAQADPSRRTAGQYARETVRRLRMRTIVALGILAVATALLGRAFGLHDVRFLSSEVALLVTIFVTLRYVLPLVERHDRGAAGEEHVGAVIEALGGSGWRVIHDASIGRGNVDHIVVGPGGIYTVETKSHPGPVRVRRIHGATIAQALGQARRLERATGLQAEPLIVYSRAWVDRPLARRKGVRVVPARMLGGYLAGREERLAPEAVERAYGVIVEALVEQGPRPRVVRDRWQLSRQ
jgi:hypothetical protein